MKGLVTMNMHVKYERPVSRDSDVIAKVKVFEKYVKLQGQRHLVKNYE